MSDELKEARLKEARLNRYRSQPVADPAADRLAPIPLNAAQENAAKEWAADDRLWTTQETVEFNLRTFARVILKHAEEVALSAAQQENARLLLERDSAREQFDRHAEWAADHCACVLDGRGSLTSECQEHQQVREQRDCLLAALKAVAETDRDCPACDRGVLRHPENGHWPTCPFGHADIAIAAAEGRL